MDECKKSVFGSISTEFLPTLFHQEIRDSKLLPPLLAMSAYVCEPNCHHRGEFNVDLRHTGFRVADAVRWLQYGHRIASHIERFNDVVKLNSTNEEIKVENEFGISQFKVCGWCKDHNLHKMWWESLCHYCSEKCADDHWPKHKLQPIKSKISNGKKKRNKK